MAEIKEMDKAGLDFLIQNEGIRLSVYKDSVGVWTIGVGSTYWEDGSRVKETDPQITMDRAISLFKTTLVQYERTVWTMTRDDITQGQFNALVSFTYNVGVNAFKSSTLLKRINAGASNESIKSAFMMWNKPAAIIGRRKREANLYLASSQ